MPSQSDFLLLSPSCFLKQLEERYVYNIETDELYETNAEAFSCLKLCDGSRRVGDIEIEDDFLHWCLGEGILTLTSGEARRQLDSGSSPVPSLRYLELQITARCNLKCRHCYLGEAKSVDLPTEKVMAVLEQFERMQGLRLLISGGEPLLHPDFWTINEAISRFGFHSVLLTNGTMIDTKTADKLQTHQVQVSLDGIGDSHDFLRGSGSFNKALSAIKELRRSGRDVSVATMIHSRNLQDFPRLASLVDELGVKEWSVDLPCVTGRMEGYQELGVPEQEAARFLHYGFGGGLYTSSADYACGAHLCAVMPDGAVAKCGFFAEQPVGNIDEGLRECWERLKPIRLDELDCHCSHQEECRGGCRYRALLDKNLYAPDPVQCYFRGVT